MSLASMTGFARHEGALGDWAWAVESRSVNGRNLEVRFRGPPGFDGLERAARDLAQARFARGSLTINIQGRSSAKPSGGRVNLDAVERYLALCAPFVADGRAAPPTMDGLLALPGVVETSTSDEDPDMRAAVEAAMAVSMAQALDALKVARSEEGAALATLLNGFLDHIARLVAVTATEAEQQPALIKDRFARRLTELVGEAASAERIVQEAAALALKADVREELDRLTGHVAAARALLAQAVASGRRLDFLTQELMREVNTLCAKSAAAALTTVGLELKATIDQFREQVQNVE